MAENKRVSRARSVSDLLNQKHKELDFDGKWLAGIGRPEVTGSWLIWGPSANGKTRFALQLAKYLAQFRRVAINSLEEGASLSMRKAFRDEGMREVQKRIILLDREPTEELINRLEKRKSPDVIIIDSIQYMGLSYKDYKLLRDRFFHKLFVMISHAEGTLPEGRVAKAIMYDAFVKVRVEGYRAFPASRYGGNEPITVWEEGAEKYWGKI